MPRQTGACVPCGRLQAWFTKGRASVWLPDCEKCGGDLERPGTRAYRVVHLAWWGRQRVAHIRAGAAPRWIGRFRPPHAAALDTIAADNMAVWARELAHEALALYPELRFEFDTDAEGRVINERAVASSAGLDVVGRVH